MGILDRWIAKQRERIIMSFLKKYINDFIAGAMASLTVLVSSYTQLPPEVLEHFQNSNTIVLIAIVGTLIGGVASAFNTKKQVAKVQSEKE